MTINHETPAPERPSGGGAMGAGDPERAGPVLDGPLFGPAPARWSRRDGPVRLERSAPKVLFIGGGSLLVPGVFLPFALFALVSALWLVHRLPQGAARTRARAALAVAVLAVAVHTGVLAYLAFQRGWFG